MNLNIAQIVQGVAASLIVIMLVGMYNAQTEGKNQLTKLEVGLKSSFQALRRDVDKLQRSVEQNSNVGNHLLYLQNTTKDHELRLRTIESGLPDRRTRGLTVPGRPGPIPNQEVIE